MAQNSPKNDSKEGQKWLFSKDSHIIYCWKGYEEQIIYFVKFCRYVHFLLKNGPKQPKKWPKSTKNGFFSKVVISYIIGKHMTRRCYFLCKNLIFVIFSPRMAQKSPKNDLIEGQKWSFSKDNHIIYRWKGQITYFVTFSRNVHFLPKNGPKQPKISPKSTKNGFSSNIVI